MAALHYNYNFILSLYSFNLTLGDSPKANDTYFHLPNVKMYTEFVS